MRSMTIAACLALSFAFGSAIPLSVSTEANERVVRTAPKASSSQPAHYSQRADQPRYERKCIIMECGTPWCFNTRVN
jgi:hypothetical protein